MIIPAANIDIRSRNLSQSNTIANTNRLSNDSDFQSKATEALKDQFTRQFRDLASDPDKFYDLLKTVYGSNIDRDMAVTLRTQALRGDLSWMPEVKVVNSQTLQQGELQGLGAYSAKNNVIYLNEKILATPELAQKVFNEEVGHALDTILNTADARGDEGALFSRMLSGEKISTGERSQIRSENDSGVIKIDGRDVEVEFYMNNNNNNANNNRNNNANNNSFSFVPGQGTNYYPVQGSGNFGSGSTVPTSAPATSPVTEQAPQGTTPVTILPAIIITPEEEQLIKNQQIELYGSITGAAVNGAFSATEAALKQEGFNQLSEKVKYAGWAAAPFMSSGVEIGKLGENSTPAQIITASIIGGLKALDETGIAILVGLAVGAPSSVTGPGGIFAGAVAGVFAVEYYKNNFDADSNINDWLDSLAPQLEKAVQTLLDGSEVVIDTVDELSNEINYGIANLFLSRTEDGVVFSAPDNNASEIALPNASAPPDVATDNIVTPPDLTLEPPSDSDMAILLAESTMGTIVTVESGDTLSQLTIEAYPGGYNPDMIRKVAEFNGLSNANSIRVGQQLDFPPIEVLNALDNDINEIPNGTSPAGGGVNPNDDLDNPTGASGGSNLPDHETTSNGIPILGSPEDTTTSVSSEPVSEPWSPEKELDNYVEIDPNIDYSVLPEEPVSEPWSPEKEPDNYVEIDPNIDYSVLPEEPVGPWTPA